MSDFWRDAELNELVREINRSEDAAGRPKLARQVEPSVLPGGQTALQLLLSEMVSREASDLLLIAGAPPVLRIHGELVWLGGEPIDDLGEILAPYLHSGRLDRIDAAGAVDFSIRQVKGGQPRRFRVNIHRQRGESGLGADPGQAAGDDLAR